MVCCSLKLESLDLIHLILFDLLLVLYSALLSMIMIPYDNTDISYMHHTNKNPKNKN